MSADVLKDFNSLLGGIQPIAAAVSGRIFAPWDRERGNEYPQIMWQKSDVDREEARTNTGTGGLASFDLTLVVLARSYRHAQEVAEIIRVNLDQYSGTVGLTEFQLVSIVSETDDFISELKADVVLLDLEVWAAEEAPANAA